MNPLVHYLKHGAAEGRDPSPKFDTQWYVGEYEDVARAGINPLNRHSPDGRRFKVYSETASGFWQA